MKIAKETVEMMRASELRKRRKMGGFFGADRTSPIEYFMVSLSRDEDDGASVELEGFDDKKGSRDLAA